MAITSHPLATRAAGDILAKGGNACDAALAASITQTVVEPHMTTITGCLSQMYFDQATGETTYVNGNVNAPMAPLPGYGRHDLAGGRGVAVPGWWGGFEAAHDRHGSLPPQGPDGGRDRLCPGRVRDAPVPLGRGLHPVRQDRPDRRGPRDLLRRERHPPPGDDALPEAGRGHAGAAGRGGQRLLLPGRLRRRSSARWSRGRAAS